MVKIRRGDCIIMDHVIFAKRKIQIKGTFLRYYSYLFKRTEAHQDEIERTQKRAHRGNKAGYTAQDAPSMRTFHLQK